MAGSQRRGWGGSNKNPWKRLYDKSAWQRLRLAHLGKEPLCRYCYEDGNRVPGEVVDHIKPHNGAWDLFFDADNLQTLCRMHHDNTKQREESNGSVLGCDANGIPLDKASEWRIDAGETEQEKERRERFALFADPLTRKSE